MTPVERIDADDELGFGAAPTVALIVLAVIAAAVLLAAGVALGLVIAAA